MRVTTDSKWTRPNIVEFEDRLCQRQMYCGSKLYAVTLEFSWYLESWAKIDYVQPAISSSCVAFQLWPESGSIISCYKKFEIWSYQD